MAQGSPLFWHQLWDYRYVFIVFTRTTLCSILGYYWNKFCNFFPTSLPFSFVKVSLKQGSTVQTLVRSSTIQVIAQIIHTRQFSPFMKQIIDCFATCYYVLPPASYIIYAYRNFTRQSFDTNHLRIQKIVRRSRSQRDGCVVGLRRSDTLHAGEAQDRRIPTIV